MNKQTNKKLSSRITFARASLVLAMAAAGAVSGTNAYADAYTADFNDDGFEEIIIGNSSARVSNQAAAGSVSVIETDEYGFRPGMYADTWNQNTDGDYDGPERLDRYGHAVAIGDFNGDGYDDMATSAPWDSRSGGYKGTVHIVYGSQNGLRTGGMKTLIGSRTNKLTGYSFAVADFDQDGYDDLAAGSPGEGNEAGGVWMYLGHPAGLGRRSYFLSQASSKIVGSPQAGGQFGFALAAGDTDCNGWTDLMVGAPGTDTTRGTNAGIVLRVRFGPGATNNIIGSTIYTDVLESSNRDDRFGSTLAVGYFNTDDCADVAIGHSDEKVGSKRAAGAVTIIYGSEPGSSPVQRDLWYQGRSDIPGRAESYDRFGQSLTVGDFDDDGRDDLAIGTPGEGFESTWSFDKKAVGVVYVLYGGFQGLTYDSRASYWYQGYRGLKGSKGSWDYFGKALSTGDYDNDGYEDLLVAVPTDSQYGSVGVLQIIHGGPSGLRAKSTEPQIIYKGNVNGMNDHYFVQSLP